MNLMDRERAEECHWALLQEERFHRRVQRDRAFGLWLARRIGLRGDEAEEFAAEVVAIDIAVGERSMLPTVWASRLVRYRLSMDELQARLDETDFQFGLDIDQPRRASTRRLRRAEHSLH